MRNRKILISLFLSNRIFQQRVSLIFGIITCFAGLTGVILGSEAARRLDKSVSFNHLKIFRLKF